MTIIRFSLRGERGEELDDLWTEGGMAGVGGGVERVSEDGPCTISAACDAAVWGILGSRSLTASSCPNRPLPAASRSDGKSSSCSSRSRSSRCLRLVAAPVFVG